MKKKEKLYSRKEVDKEVKAAEAKLLENAVKRAIGFSGELREAREIKRKLKITKKEVATQKELIEKMKDHIITLTSKEEELQNFIAASPDVISELAIKQVGENAELHVRIQNLHEELDAMRDEMHEEDRKQIEKDIKIQQLNNLNNEYRDLLDTMRNLLCE